MAARVGQPMEWMQAMADAVREGLQDGSISDKEGLQRAKARSAKQTGAPRMPQDPELLPLLDDETRRRFGHLLRKKPMRSQSGVAIIAVMSSPAACPHGKCIYCPGGPDVDAPQSYTGFEPSTMRAKRHGYDAYRIVRGRLHTLQHNGHAIDKLDIVVQGGTFPARDQAYQDWFIAGIYAACNDGPDDADAPWHSEAAWQAMEADARRAALQDLMRINESAACRVIGLTVETKPDWCLQPHVDAMLGQGATRIELGIQTLSDEVTALTNRGHTVQDARDAMRIARDAGFKVCVHMMPGLPRPVAAPVTGSVKSAGDLGAPGTTVAATAGAERPRTTYAVDPAADIQDMEQLFADPDFRPDMIKIYPTLIVQEGETTLKTWWAQGRFEPLDTEGAVDIIAESLRHVPEYCRIQRIDRDIPTTHVLAGVMNSNLRQLAEAEAVRRGVALRDIRAREIGTRMREGAAVDPDHVEPVVRCYDASGGTEAFISMEDPGADAVAGFIRVRRIGATVREELPAGSAVVRELKVYGAATPIGEHDPETWQHQGLGSRLLEEAERVAFEQWGAQRLSVLAGPGVKEYYRRRGYADLGPYVAKDAP